MPNFYEILGLTTSADSEQVKAAFHRLAKSSHPDVNSGDATAEQRFKEANQAYEILSDPERRADYELGLKHKHAETQRRVRNAMAATAASFMITVGCGLYLSLSDWQVAGRHESTARSSYSNPAPQPKQDRLRQRAERWTKAESGSTPSPPDPQTQRDRASQSDAEPVRLEKPPAARLADENIAVVESPPPSPPGHQTQHVQPSTEPPRKEGRRPATHAGEREGTERVAQAKAETDPAAAREQERREEARAEAARFEEGAPG
jgi:curved DNA-binding protein CbpA